MLSLFYNLILFLLGLLVLPKFLWQRFRYGKYRHSIAQRLGKHLPLLHEKQGPVFWLHMCSVGETKALIPLYRKLKEELPHAHFFISSITETGHAEALKNLKGAEAYFYLPLDFSFLMKKLVKRLSPDFLILSESEFWYHLLKYVKKSGAKSVSVNGKISEKSAYLFKKFSFFSKRLFNYFDHFYVQNQIYYDRFLPFVEPARLSICGNLKLDIPFTALSASEKIQFQNQLGIKPQDIVITIGSTHAPEEKEILSVLDPLLQEFPHLKILIAPRHPERWNPVAHELSERYLISRYSLKNPSSDARIILIDTLGILMSCFQISTLAIIGGSFFPGIGGHNIFEPLQADTPVLFGPHMETQTELVEMVLKAHAGKQIIMSDLYLEVKNLLNHPPQLNQMKQHAHQTVKKAQGATERVFKELKNLFCW